MSIPYNFIIFMISHLLITNVYSSEIINDSVERSSDSVIEYDQKLRDKEVSQILSLWEKETAVAAFANKEPQYLKVLSGLFEDKLYKFMLKHRVELQEKTAADSVLYKKIFMVWGSVLRMTSWIPSDEAFNFFSRHEYNMWSEKVWFFPRDVVRKVALKKAIHTVNKHRSVSFSGIQALELASEDFSGNKTYTHFCPIRNINLWYIRECVQSAPFELESKISNGRVVSWVMRTRPGVFEMKNLYSPSINGRHIYYAMEKLALMFLHRDFDAVLEESILLLDDLNFEDSYPFSSHDEWISFCEKHFSNLSEDQRVFIDPLLNVFNRFIE